MITRLQIAWTEVRPGEDSARAHARANDAYCTSTGRKASAAALHSPGKEARTR